MKTLNNTITEEKENGRFYTPYFIVENILNLSSYYGNRILKKHVIDNSCGDGAFLCQIVERYCEEAIKEGEDLDTLKGELSFYIHGIDIKKKEVENCIKKVSAVAKTFGVQNVKWNIVCGDALALTQYYGKMDFVLGNPPYVRVHNLGGSLDNVKKFTFAQNGMTDLYIVFFEIGIKMLSKEGTLGYITPSSYFNSIAGTQLRNYLEKENLIKAIVNLRHFQAFSATTYSAITILKKENENKYIDYYEFDEKNLIPYYVETLSATDYSIDGNFYFSNKDDLKLIKKILCNSEKNDIAVKNGYATLCDDVFINKFNFYSDHIIPVIKSSKGIAKKIIYPYDKDSKLIPEKDLKKDDLLYDYLLKNKEKLKKRSNEKDKEKYWYAFGRSQAISDTYRPKLTINSLLRNEKDFKFVNAPAGTGVYGGLYITSDTFSQEEIIGALKSKEFISYISLLGKYKSGGYYTFSSRDVKAYLNYKFSSNKEIKNVDK